MCGYIDPGGHPEVIYRNVRVPVDHLLGSEGGGFAIAQARLGPGRIHHCIRSVGVAERALELMVVRARERSIVGTTLAHKGLIQDWIAGIKVAVPTMALKVIDRAIQVHGAAGLTQLFPLAHVYAEMRSLRIAEGPDEVHTMTIARREILKHNPSFRMHTTRDPSVQLAGLLFSPATSVD